MDFGQLALDPVGRLRLKKPFPTVQGDTQDSDLQQSQPTQDATPGGGDSTDTPYSTGGGAATPSAPPSAAPSQPTGGMDPDLVKFLVSKMQLPPELGLGGLQAAQQADQQRMALQGLGMAGARAQASVQGTQPDYTGLQPDQLNLRNFLAQRQLAVEEAQRGVQAGMLPVEIAQKMAALRGTMAHTASEEAEPGLKAQQAKAAGAAAEESEAKAQATRAQNAPITPAMLQVAQKLGLPMDPTTPGPLAVQAIEAEAKRQGVMTEQLKNQIESYKAALEGQRVALEKQKVGIEEQRYTSQHPLYPVPGVRYVGPGAPPDRDSPVVKEYQNQSTNTQQIQDALEELRQAYKKAKPGQAITDPGQRQNLQTIYTRAVDALARTSPDAVARKFPDELAREQLPNPLDVTHTLMAGSKWSQQGINAAIDRIKDMTTKDLNTFGGQRYLLPEKEAAARRANEYKAAGVTDPQKILQLLRGEGY